MRSYGTTFLWLALLVFGTVFTPGCGTDEGDDDDTQLAGNDDSGSSDLDGDGVLSSDDCDDEDAERYPGNVEICNGKDSDCDGGIDNIDPEADPAESGAQVWYVDVDGDGFGDPTASQVTCDTAAPTNYADNADDCDDGSPSVYPGAGDVCDSVLDNGCDGVTDPLEADEDGDGESSCDGDCDDTDPSTFSAATETCDGLDNNCNEEIDEGLDEAYFLDADLDGYGTSASFVTGCAGPPEGYVIGSEDCDDAEATVYPGAEPVCDAILDNDCDGLVDGDEGDADGDGQSTCNGDCDDADPANFLTNAEICDEADNDCDGVVDNGVEVLTGYADTDGDGYGDPNAAPISACNLLPEGYVADSTDCDDGRSTVHPAAEDVCDGIPDNNCDGATDYLESDDDGDGVSGCDGDCDNSDPSRVPGSLEVCDGIDNDCNDQVDDGLTFVATYADEDGDGYGAGSSPLEETCGEAPAGSSLESTDCDDGLSGVYPGADQLCDGVLDNDCDGVADVNEVDSDGDGLNTCGGDCNDTNAGAYPGADEVCDGYDDNNCDGVVDTEDMDGDGDGSTPCSGDCDDTDALNYPENTEVCDGQDNNCNDLADEDVQSFWYVDGDGDGYGDPLTITANCGEQPEGTIVDGTDCNDADATINPGAEEIVGDAIDNNCDGVSDVTFYVNQEGISPEQDKLAFRVIQNAIVAATDGAVIAVGAGTYREALDFLGKTLYLIGLEGAESTLIDADGLGASTILLASGEGAGTTIRGFTLTGGEGTLGDTCGGAPNLRFGGGMCLEGVAPKLEDLIFDGNLAGYGGGLSVVVASAPTLTNVRFTGNLATVAGGALYGDASSAGFDTVQASNNLAANGGAFYLDTVDATFTDVWMENNVATESGGGLYLDYSPVTLDWVTLANNSAGEYGGGIFAAYSNFDGFNLYAALNHAANGGGLYLSFSSAAITQGLIRGNTAVYHGGGAFIDNGSPDFVNVIFTGNVAEFNGGALSISTSSATFTNVSMSANSASSFGGGIYLYYSPIAVHNSIIAYNSSLTSGSNIYNYSDVQATINYSCLYRATGSAGIFQVVLSDTNLVGDPAFLNDNQDGQWEDDDYHVGADSITIGAGDPSEIYYDPDGSSNNLGAYGGPQADGWDLDGDGYQQWWDPYIGLDPTVDDCDDLDGSVYPGNGCD